MSLFDRLLRTAPTPGAAVEIAADRVSAATVAARGGRAVVGTHAVEALPAGLVTPSLTGQNVHDAAAVATLVGRVLEQVGGPRRVGLVVPDPVAKVSVLHFDETPSRASDLERLIRFQVRKSAPFSMEDALIAWTPGAAHGHGGDYLVSIARRKVILEYEQVMTAAGAYAGLVDLATFNVANAVLAAHAPAGDWLLVHTAAAYVSIAIFRGTDLVFFRSRSEDADDTTADMVHQTAMYYEDRLQGGGFTRVLLSGGAGDGSSQRMRQSLEARLAVPVEALDALAPLAGLLGRGRTAA